MLKILTIERVIISSFDKKRCSSTIAHQVMKTTIIEEYNFLHDS